MKHLSGHRFHTDAEVKQAVSQWLYSRSPEFYADGSVHAMMPRCDKCLNFQRDYVEKKRETFVVNKRG
jgi:hypothetical protein